MSHTEPRTDKGPSSDGSASTRQDAQQPQDEEAALHSVVPRRKWRRATQGASLAVRNVAALTIFVVAWDLLSVAVDSLYFPRPLAVWDAFYRLVEQGDLLGHTLVTHARVSLTRVLGGFTAGVILGVPLGLVMGLYRPLYASIRAVVEPARFIPPIAWIPLAIVLLSGFQRYVFLIFLGAFFPVFIATMVGVPRVDPLHLKVAHVHGAGRLYRLWHIVVPSVLPDIMGGMRVGLGAAWMTIVAAEMTGGESRGLGRMMINYAELLRIPEIIVGMILIGLLGLACNELLLIAERRLFKWRARVSL